MFSKVIIDSDMFLEMPATAQMLYFHLAMRADDDGFIGSPKRIMRMIGGSEEDWKLLILKGFLLPFESGVAVVRHWRIHNYLRSDRYRETAYLEEKSRLELQENGVYTLLEGGGETDGIPEDTRNGCQRETQDRIGEDRIGQDRIESPPSDGGTPAPLDYPSITDAFNRLCVSQPKVRSITGRRKKAMKNAAGTVEAAGGFEALFQRVEASDFLSGRVKGWTCGFDWILKPVNLTKILEGNYDNRAGTAARPDYTDTSRYEKTGWEE